MWPQLPKKCNCNNEPTNENYTCDHCGLTTNDFAFDGKDLGCTDINNQDSLTVAIQKIEESVCGIGAISNILTTVQNNPGQYSDLTNLILSAYSCEIFDECGPPPTTTTTTTIEPTTTTTTSSTTTSSTTTTTTTLVPTCANFELLSTESNASWTAQLCYDEGITGGVIPVINTIQETGCIMNDTLVLIGCEILAELGECTTTTTTSTTQAPTTTTTSTTVAPTTTTTSTSTSSTTTTSTSSTTTTTTTTLKPGALVLENNSTDVTIEDISATGWTIGIATPCPPLTTMSGVHAHTTHPINVSVSAAGIDDYCLSLWINGVLQPGSITFSTTGIYVFPAVSISNSSTVRVKITPGVCV